MVSSAVYRYVASRDELLTLLVVDGYDELGDAVDAALAQVDTRRPRGADGRDRPRGAGLGAGRAGDVRPALRQPGAGLRGARRAHHRARDAGGRPAGRGLGGRLGARACSRVPDATGRRPAGSRATWPGSAGRWGSRRRTRSSRAGMLAWAALFGCVSFEVFGQYGADTFTDPSDLFEHHLDVLVEAVGL